MNNEETGHAVHHHGGQPGKPAPSHEARPGAAATGPTEYVCPMHPEIVRSEPGNCPICGMALEPKTISADDEQNPELADMKRRFWVSLALTAQY